MFHIGQLVRMVPSKLPLGYPGKSKDDLLEWYSWFTKKYSPVFVVQKIFPENKEIGVLLKHVSGSTDTSIYPECIFEPIELDFIEEEYIVQT